MNSFSPEAIRAETITLIGYGGDEIEAYQAVPLDEGSRGGIVWIHHMPGYDRETKEFVRRLAVNGYNVVAPNLYTREAPGAAPDDAAAAARAAGGVPDERLVGDVALDQRSDQPAQAAAQGARRRQAQRGGAPHDPVGQCATPLSTNLMTPG